MTKPHLEFPASNPGAALPRPLLPPRRCSDASRLY